MKLLLLTIGTLFFISSYDASIALPDCSKSKKKDAFGLPQHGCDTPMAAPEWETNPAGLRNPRANTDQLRPQAAPNKNEIRDRKQ